LFPAVGSGEDAAWIGGPDEFALVSATKRSIAALSSLTEQKAPRWSRRRVSVAKKP
jgi:hypothetical protein